jgi:hypothetical protein
MGSKIMDENRSDFRVYPVSTKINTSATAPPVIPRKARLKKRNGRWGHLAVAGDIVPNVLISSTWS